MLRRWVAEGGWGIAQSAVERLALEGKQQQVQGAEGLRG